MTRNREARDKFWAVQHSKRTYQCICMRCNEQPVNHPTPRNLFCWPCKRERNAVAVRAISLVARAVKKGLMPKAKECVCVDCGLPAFDHDHRDYLKPLDVVPVCRGCNQRRGPALDDKWRGPFYPTTTTDKAGA